MVHFVHSEQRAFFHGCSILVVVGRVVGEPVPQQVIHALGINNIILPTSTPIKQCNLLD